MNSDPKLLLGIGFVLLLLGVGLPFFMVIRPDQSTFFLNFLSYIFQVTGLVVGFLGAMGIVARRRRDR
jgi:hypothetical protein